MTYFLQKHPNIRKTRGIPYDQYGINVSDIQNMIEAAIGGKAVDAIYDRDKKYDLIVRYVPENRNSLDVIKSIQVPSAKGELIPMG